jgi:hypothetical protein
MGENRRDVFEDGAIPEPGEGPEEGGKADNAAQYPGAPALHEAREATTADERGVIEPNREGR